MLPLQRVTEFGVERKPGNDRIKKCDREVTETREVVCPSHMNVKGQGFAGKHGLEVAQGSEEDIYLNSGVLVTWNVGEKTAFGGHGKGVFREPPYFEREVVIWRCFRRELNMDWIRSGHTWRMCSESVVMDAGDAGTSGAMRWGGGVCAKQ